MFAFNMKMAAIDLKKHSSASKTQPDSSNLLWNFVGKNSDSDDKSPSHIPSDTSIELVEDEKSTS